jgi:hypothetical protein
LDRTSTISCPGAAVDKTSAGARRDSGVSLALVVFCALALSLLLQQQRLLTVWRGGGFFDTDDAMRMVQVRDLLAGQNWYDMTQWRLDPPGGVFMHWSRIVDIPIVALIKLFGHFLPAEAAERAARIAWPTLTFGILLSGGAWAARIFAGAEVRIFGVFTVLFCGVMFWQFPPGRIDHHAQQITLLFFCVAALARALDPAQARWAALSGGCMAVSLGIGLENVPFFAILAAVPGLVLVTRGDEARGLLLSFAAGLAATLSGVYLLTIAPERWFIPACDALSPPWAVAALGGAAAYVLLSFSGRLGLVGRFFALAALGAAALAPMLLLWPNCLRDPYAGVDPLVKSLWLDHVSENLTLRENFTIAPTPSLLMAVPIAIGFCGALFAAFIDRGLSRARWLLLAVVIAVGFTTASLCLRAFSSTMPLAALGLLAPVDFLRRRLMARGVALANSAAFIALFFISSFGVALALPDLPERAGAANSPDMAWRRPDPCLESANYEPLAALQPGLAVAQIPAGSYLLAHTGLSVLAAPYHRNNLGNRAALDILRAEPPLAESLTRKAGAKYVLLCWGNAADAAALKALGPEALAAKLSQGQVPGWLRPLKIEASIFHVYAVMPSSE